MGCPYVPDLRAGISPEELAVRLGAGPQKLAEPVTLAQLLTTPEGKKAARVAQFGEDAGWSFAVEYGAHSKAWWAKPSVSEGCEVVQLTPKPDDPPRECWYYRDGAGVGHFDFGAHPGSLCEGDDGVTGDHRGR